MMPSMAARLMSFADVEYRQQELAREFADGRWGRRRRARRRQAAQTTPSTAAVVAPTSASTPAPVTAPLPATEPEPAVVAPSDTSSLVDDRLPVG
jgi:hypothetical protein